MSSPPSSASAVSEPEAEVPLSKSTSSSPNRAIAFLVHSPNSISNNLPPDCDNKPLARQRRRRTSPDDQRILEEAFARNPRPNKEERREIITKVALGDKEVQIWFQNRRQSSRRKSKPLDNHEAESRHALKSSSPILSSEPDLDLEKVPEEDIVRATGSENNTATAPAVDTSVEEAEVPTGKEEAAAEATKDEGESVAREEKGKAEVESQDTVLTTSITSSQGPPPSTLPTDLGSSQDLSSSQEALFTSMTRPTYLANRRSATFARQHPEEPVAASQPAVPAEKVPTLRKSGSYLRLSMTEDGQAKVIDRSVPSPPRSQQAETSPTTEQAPVSGLRRSYSAAGLNDLFKQSASQPTNPTKVARVSQAGRSRDSRAWEFWCDSEARTSLANKAEQENSGSAADAIGLIRQSSRNALRPNSRKANSPMVSQGSFTAVNGGKPAKTKLQRASTTYGRLQQQSTTTNSTKKGAEEEVWDRSTNGDSDKENWDPDDNQADAGSHRRAQTGASNPRRGRAVLGENTQIPSYQTSLGGLMESEKKRRAAAPAAVDAEVAAFMGTGNESDDLDCVQSLLSLSKGNWR